MGQQLSLFEKPNLVQYFLLLSPPKLIQEDVREMKEKIHSRIRLSPETLRSKAHISLFEFIQINDTEETIIEKATRALHEIPEFKVHVNGFGVFNHGRSKRTVILKIQDAQAIQDLHASLLSALNLRYKKITPHLTVAKSISSDEMDQLESHLLESDYSREFLCDRISLLKQEINDDFQTGYSLVTELYLKN